MKKRGKGIGISFYGTGYGNGFPDISRARIKLLKDGRVGMYVGVTEVGQGAKTAFFQIGSEALNLSIDNITLISEDTSLMPDSGTAAASRQTYNTGNAVKKACENFRDLIIEKARQELNLNSTNGLKLEEGNIYLEYFPAKEISFKELANIYKEDTIEAEAEFIAQTTEMDPETGQGVPYWPYTFNACGIELEVDTVSGLVELLDVRFAQDVGRSVNPNLVEGQMDGGFAMALGYTLFEDINVDKGKIKHNKLSKYLIPTAMDMIDIDKIIVEDPESSAPYGAKGIGEPVMIPIAPAILNAIYNATGTRITELPVTPERLIKAIEEDRLKKNRE